MRLLDLTKKRWQLGAGILGLCALVFAGLPSAHAQRSMNPLGPGAQSGYGNGPLAGPAPPIMPNPIDAKMQQKRMKALNTARQKALVSDTNKLVKLAAQLNAQINSAHQGHLTEDQLRTVAEIEKLAKSVREKMSDASSGAPSVQEPPSQFPPMFGQPGAY